MKLNRNVAKLSQMKKIVNDEYVDASIKDRIEMVWDKVKKFAKVAGREVIEKSLWLYYAAQRPETPAWAKAVIYGSLAYFICPVDAIPDVIPVAGFIDDLGALAAALATVAVYIDEGVKAKVSENLKNWFGAGTK